jgi:hypothetical protein
MPVPVRPGRDEELESALLRRSSLSQPVQLVRCDLARFDLCEHVAAYMRERGCVDPLPLETLHERVAIADQMPRAGGPNAFATDLGEVSGAFRAAYREIVKDVAARVLGVDVFFQRCPPLRFHFPVPLSNRFRTRDGFDLTHHSDTMFGDYFEQINCWLPLTSSQGTSTLQMMGLEESIDVLVAFAQTLGGDFVAYQHSRREFFAFLEANAEWRERVLSETKPIPVEAGEIILFDGRIIHGTAENIEGVTRVSIDFRVLPVDDYHRIMRRLVEHDRPAPTVDGRTGVRGDLYEERSVLEPP